MVLECQHPVATTTPAGLPGWGPRSALGSVVSGDCGIICIYAHEGPKSKPRGASMTLRGEVSVIPYLCPEPGWRWRQSTGAGREMTPCRLGLLPWAATC